MQQFLGKRAKVHKNTSFYNFKELETLSDIFSSNLVVLKVDFTYISPGFLNGVQSSALGGGRFLFHSLLG